MSSDQRDESTSEDGTAAIRPMPFHTSIATLMDNAKYVSRERLVRRAQATWVIDSLVFFILATCSTFAYVAIVAPYPLLSIVGLRRREESYLRCAIGYQFASVWMRLALIFLSKDNVGFILWGCVSLILNFVGGYYNYVIAKEIVSDKETSKIMFDEL